VPLYEAPPLARALYASTRDRRRDTPDLYLAVARVLAYLFQLRRARPTDYVPRPTGLEIPESYSRLMDEEHMATTDAPAGRGIPGGLLTGMGTPLVMLLLLVMIVLPLPPLALDVLFTFNIALAIIVLLAAVYAARPLEFAVFPTVLLIATLLRLGLNVASTRVVLLEGHTGTGAAGNVIEAFGDFVVGGSYAVGLVLFTILVVINFVVVTKGAGRISEVTARFTLDAMPGKQMAIDADLNAGLINSGRCPAPARGSRARRRISTVPWTARASSCAATRSPAS
jgi:hypothetical protein